MSVCGEGGVVAVGKEPFRADFPKYQHTKPLSETQVLGYTYIYISLASGFSRFWGIESESDAAHWLASNYMLEGENQRRSVCSKRKVHLTLG